MTPGELRYTRRAFWIVKVPFLVLLIIWIWNMAADRREYNLMQDPRVKYALSGHPVVLWGGLVYPALELNPKKGIVKMRKEPLKKEDMEP